MKKFSSKKESDFKNSHEFKNDLIEMLKEDNKRLQEEIVKSQTKFPTEEEWKKTIEVYRPDIKASFSEQGVMIGSYKTKASAYCAGMLHAHRALRKLIE